MIMEIDKMNIVNKELIELKAALGIEFYPLIFEAMKKCTSNIMTSLKQ